MAEAKALLLRISMATSLNEETIVKIVCLYLVDALRKPPSSWPLHCAAWLHHMLDKLDQNRNIGVSFTAHALNHLADRVAKAAAYDKGQDSWVTILPLSDM
ncbi:hypothetical protein LINPERHAP2_LOCUS9360 [Linum perenne]